MYSATMLHNLISDMMDLAKFETQTFTFNYEYFNILDVINKSFEQVRYLADEKGIKLKQSTQNLCLINKKAVQKSYERIPSLSSEETPKVSVSSCMDLKLQDFEVDQLPQNLPEDLLVLQNIYGDQRRYLQLILNFLSNALKFTPKDGSIQIRVNIIEQ